MSHVLQDCVGVEGTMSILGVSAFMFDCSFEYFELLYQLYQRNNVITCYEYLQAMV